MGSATFRAFAQPPFLPTPLSASSSDAAAVFLSQARALTQQMAEPFASEARRQAQEYVARLTPNPVCFPSPKAPGPPSHVLLLLHASMDAVEPFANGRAICPAHTCAPILAHHDYVLSAAMSLSPSPSRACQWLSHLRWPLPSHHFLHCRPFEYACTHAPWR